MTDIPEDVANSNMYQHAVRELDIAGIPEEDKVRILSLIEAVAKLHLSGGEAGWFLNTFIRLFQYENLTSLTTDPEEWEKVDEDMAGVPNLWQNKRNIEAFSHDGGKTYHLLSQDGVTHTSKNHLQRG